MTDICAFCQLPISDDELTFVDDEGHILHSTCAEVEAEESEQYLEADSDSD